MYIVADSGSTKTECCIVDNKNIINRIISPGINPYYQQEDEIKDVIETYLLPNIDSKKIKKIFFYGAGCNSTEKNKMLSNVFNILIPDSFCEINSDLLGACRGMLKNKAGIAAILGTGSNSCYYDGKEIIKNVSPLGFILGDEGSGAYLGKILVANCLKNQVADHIRDLFFKEMHLKPLDIIENVYRRPFPNRYLADLSRFLINHIEEPDCEYIVHDAFTAFFKRNLLQYEGFKDFEISFTGSISFYYKDILEAVAKEFGSEGITVCRTPMDGLIEYHNN